MDAKTLILLVFLPIICFGQKSMYPKDTIYILYDTKKHSKIALNHPEMGKNLYFKNIGVYYNYKGKLDTLCSKHLKDYQLSNLKEIRKKEIDWVDRKYVNSEYKPYSGSRNAVFQTYLIEIISEEQFVIYPVIWRNEKL